MDELQQVSQRIERLMPLVQARAGIDGLVAPVAPRRTASAAAFGRVLAGEIIGAHSHPASAVALCDGFALRAEATLDASAYAPVPVAAVAVESGDLLPEGADAVAPIEAIELRGTAAFAVAPLAPGDGVLPAGADAAPKEVMYAEGVRLRAVDLAALTAIGVSQIDVREPRVRVAAASAADDRFVASIVGLLSRAIHGAGGVAVAPSGTNLDRALDDPGADAVVVIGGSGRGQRDRSIRELTRRGTLAFHGVGMSPGETAAFGMIGQRPVLVVPGRVDATLAAWLLLGRPMLARLCGSDDTARGTPATLTRKIASTLGLAELVPVAREQDGVTPLASGYLSLQSLARAHGYVLVPADSEGFPAGARVEMSPLP